MQRIPKYTAGMFKKKTPRFGASSIRMPSMPKPPKPRVKKFEGGGKTETEVIISPEEGAKFYPELAAKTERTRKQRELERSKDLVKRYLYESKKAEEEKAKKKLDADQLKKQFDAYMEERKKQDAIDTSEYMRQMKQGVKTAKSGGVMKSSSRGDGIARKGKTRGRFV